MAATEIDSFIQKFTNLWKSGLDAHLDIDTHAGQAWVGLRVGLGGGPNLLHEVQQHQAEKATKANSSPSRLRRRARRESARKVKASEAIQEPNVTEVGNYADKSESVETKDDKAAEAVIVEETEVIENIADNENGKQEENDLKESSEITETIAENANQDEPNENVMNSEPVEDVVTAENMVEVNVYKEFVTIEATAVVEDSPNVTFVNDELESIYRFIASKDHLIKNIADAQSSHLSSREF